MTKGIALVTRYLDACGAYYTIVDSWKTTTDGEYVLVNDYGNFYVLIYRDGTLYNSDGEDVIELQYETDPDFIM